MRQVVFGPGRAHQLAGVDGDLLAAGMGMVQRNLKAMPGGKDARIAMCGCQHARLAKYFSHRNVSPTRLRATLTPRSLARRGDASVRKTSTPSSVIRACDRWVESR